MVIKEMRKRKRRRRRKMKRNMKMKRERKRTRKRKCVSERGDIRRTMRKYFMQVTSSSKPLNRSNRKK